MKNFEFSVDAPGVSETRNIEAHTEAEARVKIRAGLTGEQNQFAEIECHTPIEEVVAIDVFFDRKNNLMLDLLDAGVITVLADYTDAGRRLDIIYKDGIRNEMDVDAGFKSNCEQLFADLISARPSDEGSISWITLTDEIKHATKQTVYSDWPETLSENEVATDLEMDLGDASGAAAIAMEVVHATSSSEKQRLLKSIFERGEAAVKPDPKMDQMTETKNNLLAELRAAGVCFVAGNHTDGEGLDDASLHCYMFDDEGNIILEPKGLEARVEALFKTRVDALVEQHRIFGGDFKWYMTGDRLIHNFYTKKYAPPHGWDGEMEGGI